MSSQYLTHRDLDATWSVRKRSTNVPAVYLGDKIANKVPLTLVHGIAALIFAALGVATLLGAGAKLGV